MLVLPILFHKLIVTTFSNPLNGNEFNTHVTDFHQHSVRGSLIELTGKHRIASALCRMGIPSNRAVQHAVCSCPRSTISATRCIIYRRSLWPLTSECPGRLPGSVSSPSWSKVLRSMHPRGPKSPPILLGIGWRPAEINSTPSRIASVRWNFAPRHWSAHNQSVQSLLG